MELPEIKLPSSPPSVHNGTYTVSHPNHGHFTVKLHTAKKGKLTGKRILSLLVGSNNATDYQGVGFWHESDKEVLVWKRHRGSRWIRVDGYHWGGGETGEGLSSVQKRLAIWCDLARRGTSGYWSSKGYVLLLEGRCVTCNRKLSTPEGVESGVCSKCGGRS